MKKSILTIVFLCLSSIILMGQVNDIEKEIMTYHAGKPILISQGRQFLSDKFMEGDWQKVNEITDYLLQIEDTNYIALYPREYWYILYNTQGYPELLMDIRDYTATFTMPPYTLSCFTYSKYPVYLDKLAYNMHKETLANKNRIKEQIKASEIGQREKDFLNLHLDWLLLDNRNAQIQDSLNEKADTFLATYDSTVYDDFIRTQIRYKLKASKWGGIYDVSLGYGMFTHHLVKHYTNPFVVGLSFGALYKGFDLSFNINICAINNKQDIPYSNGIFEKKSSLSMVSPYLTLGHEVFKNKRFRITPYMGFGGSSITIPTDKKEEDKALKEVELRMQTAFVGGLKLEIKVGKHSFYSPFSYNYISVRYNYMMPSFQRKYDGMLGNLHTITIGFGGVLRDAKREY